MDIRQLKYFLAVAEEGQVTRAARRLHMEQPPLSRQIRQMETELGVALFDRSRQRLRLTEAGVLLKEKAEALLIQFEETVQETKEIGAGVKGRLSVGAAVSCISLLSKPIEQFRKQHPQVTFRILEGDHAYLGERLQQREVDLVIVRLPFEAEIDPIEFEVARLPSDPFVAVVPMSWEAFLRKQRIPMKQLAEFPFLSLKSDKTIRLHERLVEECRKHGFEPNVIGECSSVAIILSLVAEGLGATVLPKSVMAAFQAPTVKALDLEDADVQSTVGVIRLKHRYLSKSARHFHRLLTQ